MAFKYKFIPILCNVHASEKKSNICEVHILTCEIYILSKSPYLK
jgi:hypothetical protein